MGGTIRRTYQDARRLRTIVSVLFDAGFSSSIDAARLKYLVPVRSRLRLSLLSAKRRERLERPVPVRVREAFERLGPTFVKFGQMLSLRADLVGEEFAREFAKLQQDAPPFPYAEVERIVRSELGKPVAKAFVTFDRKPLAAASLAQVHRATLSGKRTVAVKVERPSIRRVIEHDLHLMFLLAHLAERSVPALARYRPVAVVREFADWTLRELDFTVEAANIDRFRANFAGEEDVRVPEVVWSHTRREVLTMELVTGKPITAFFGKKAPKPVRERIAAIATRALLKMYFVDGFFHADPHPGNFLVLPGPRLALLDFGMVGYLPAELRSELVSCFLSYIERDPESYVKHLLDLAEPGAHADLRGFRREVQGVLERVMYRPSLRNKGFAGAFANVVNLGAAYDVRFPTDLVLFARSLLTIEAVALRLVPDFDVDAVARPFVDELLRSQFDPARAAGELRANMFDYLSFVRRLPERTMTLLKKLEVGEVGVRVDIGELRDLKEEFDRENDVRVVGLVAAALFVGSAVFLQYGEGHLLWGFPVGHVALLTSMALFLWTALEVIRRPRV